MNLRFAIFSILAVVFGLVSFDAKAGDLSAPFAQESTLTLPKGVRNPRFISVYGAIESKFGVNGDLEGMGQRLNKTVSWQSVLEAQEDSIKRASVLGLLQANGMDEKGSPGQTTGEVNTLANVRVFAVAMGVTDRLTLAGVLPRVKVQVNASTGFVASTEGRRFVNAAAEGSSPIAAFEAAQKLNDAVNQKLSRLGYETIPNFQEIEGFGDAQIVGKYRVRDNGIEAVAAKATLILPTGIAANPDRALDVPTGDHRYGVGLGMVYDRKFSEYSKWIGAQALRWNGYGNAIAQLPHRIMKRLPVSADDSLSSDKEELQEANRYRWALGTGVDAEWHKYGLQGSVGYHYQHMTGVHFEPGQFDSNRYTLLDDLQPEQTLQSLLVSAGFSTVQWFREKKFVAPLQFNLAYTHPLSGQSVAANDLFVGELVLFF